jgi:hypothetical protein
MPELQASEILERHGLFRFHADERTLEELLSGSSNAGFDPTLRDYLALSAAELSLVSLLVDPRPALPVSESIAVDRDALVLAAAKANCASLEYPCWDPSRLAPSDVTVFAGDVTKLATVGLTWEGGSLPSTNDFAEAVERLEGAHRSAGTYFSRALAESGVLRLQGFLWAVKARLAEGDLENCVAECYEAFQLHASAGGALPTG